MKRIKYPCHRRMAVADLLGNKYPQNPRVVTAEALATLNDQIESLGNLQPLTYNVRTQRIISGNQRIELYAQRGDKQTDVWCVDLDEEKERVAVIALNNHAGEFDLDILKQLTEAIAKDDDAALALAGFRPGELEALLAAANDGSETGKSNQRQAAHKKLSETFLVPPFSVLDARQGYWKERKAAWIALGLQGELGRPDVGSIQDKAQTGFNAILAQKSGIEDAFGGGTSIFDPVLTEAMLHWFCPPHGSVLDPFGGGVTRGAVAGCTGHHYLGIELSKAQIKANESQWPTIKSPAASSTAKGKEAVRPEWIEGDARDLASLTGGSQFDFVMTCPPYADLEVYSDDPRDLSTMPYDKFLVAYRQIIAAAIKALRNDRFAVIVVGEVRGKVQHGVYYNFVADTIDAFRRAGAHYYNEMILVTSIGSLPVCAARQFQAGRKIGKTHQNVLVFVKGDASAANTACGPIVIPETIESELAAGGAWTIAPDEEAA